MIELLNKFGFRNAINNPFHNQSYQVCTKTVMDTTDVEISFDKDGVSNHFYEYYQKANKILLPHVERENVFNNLIDKIRHKNTQTYKLKIT